VRTTLREKGSDLARLCPQIEGTVKDGRLVGRYQGYAVEADPVRENPAPEMPSAQGGTRQPGPKVDIFKLKLAGVAGRFPWDCRNEPTLLANLALVLPARLVFPLIPTAFRFHRSPLEWFAKKVGVPAADAELQARLRAAGLFDELATLRWGPNPYLPKATFNPRGQAIDEARLTTFGAALKESVAQRHPGELSLQVESGVPSEERFQELLDRAMRVARINEQETATEPTERRRT